MSVIQKYIEYPGIDGSPTTIAQLKVEMCGLKNAIKIAEELISRYEQVLAIMELKKEVHEYALQKKSIAKDKKSERD